MAKTFSFLMTVSEVEVGAREGSYSGFAVHLFPTPQSSFFFKEGKFAFRLQRFLFRLFRVPYMMFEAFGMSWRVHSPGC